MTIMHRVPVRCLTPAEGGRQTPILTGYMAPCYWGDSRIPNGGCSGRLLFVDNNPCENPWGWRVADLELILPARIPDRFSFIMREGRKISAYGRVLDSREVH